MTRVLVTGAAGFIGSHCCRALLDARYEVTGLDNFDPFYDRQLKEAGLAPLLDRDRFLFREGDIRNAADLAPALEGVGIIVHLAARAGVRPSIEEPAQYTSINVDGTVSVLEAARHRGIRRVVFGSSSSVYGDTTPVPFSESAAAVDPISPYAATKRAAELLCRTYQHLFGWRVASLRFFTVYGARQRPDLAIHKFTKLIAAGQPIQQFGDGSSERDYTYVDDIVLGVLGAVRWVEAEEPAYEVFNLGESQTVRLDRLIRLIGEALGVEPRVEQVGRQPGDVRRTCADIAKARAVLGYRPMVPIDEGIPRFVHWYEETHGRPA